MGLSQFHMPKLDDDTDEERDDEDEDLLEASSVANKSVNALLVKAWEQQVFPVIRRRFRNDSERKDGQEQIRGALFLGMTEIATQTVEGLYENEGGIPGDLKLPTIDEVRCEIAKFSVNTVKKGDAVLIKNGNATFATLAQTKTFGLLGEVVDVDRKNEVVKVEVELKEDGVLVSWWYPIMWLERPESKFHTYHRPIDGGSGEVHRELLNSEFALSRMYCRGAYLSLIDHAKRVTITNELHGNSPTLMSNVALLRDVDTENLQHLSNNSLASGNILDLTVGKGRDHITGHLVLSGCLYQNPRRVSGMWYTMLSALFVQRELN